MIDSGPRAGPEVGGAGGSRYPGAMNLGLDVPALAAVVGARVAPGTPETPIVSLRIDSRSVQPGDVFFALRGAQADGHAYAEQALRNGAVAVVVERGRAPATGLALEVDDPLAALQAAAAWHRARFTGTVVAVTGSNGKTIVKDALTALLSTRFRVAATPGSWNSQVGVPLAVLSAPMDAEMYIFEAGISAPGEMPAHARILRPDVGVLTNIGVAHIGSLGSREQTAREKLALFQGIVAPRWTLVPGDEPQLSAWTATTESSVMYHSGPAPVLRWEIVEASRTSTLVRLAGTTLEVPTTSPHLLQDVMVAAQAAFLLGVPVSAMGEVLAAFTFPSTRMEHWRSPEGLLIVNDACSADPLSVQAAVRATAQAADPAGRKVFVFAGMRELGADEERQHQLVGRLAAEQGFGALVAVGDAPGLGATCSAFAAAAPGAQTVRVASVAEARGVLRELAHPGDTVLVKGPRAAGLDQVARELWESIAPKRLIVDLSAIRENIRWFRAQCPNTKILAMLKAWAYGTELPRIARWMQTAAVDWIGVSAVDEGAAVRRAGVHLPILVLLADPAEVDKVLRYNLTLGVYSLAFARAAFAAAERAERELSVHLEVDTGMGRMGVLPREIADFLTLLRGSRFVRLTGVMTHLSSADDPTADDFTHGQLDQFDAVIAQLAAAGFTNLVRHASATSGAIRFPRGRYDMLRIGLGLYGIAPGPALADDVKDLTLAVAFVSRVARIAVYHQGDRIGYSGTFRVPTEQMRVGLVETGYNDGVPWRLSNAGKVVVRGHEVPIVGRVSMDSLTIDLSRVPDAVEGDSVLLFGEHDGAVLRPEAVAATAGTIPYELLVKVDNRRVQRVFVGD